MISEGMTQSINEQINKEFYSGYLYLSMSAYLKEKGLMGFGEMFKRQAKEELEHGLKLFDYLIERNGKITLNKIEPPEINFDNVTELFEHVYAHEKIITQSVMNIAKIAENECDRTTLSFIDWFINEQISEESDARLILKKLKLFGNEKTSLLLLDKDANNKE